MAAAPGCARAMLRAWGVPPLAVTHSHARPGEQSRERVAWGGAPKPSLGRFPS